MDKLTAIKIKYDDGTYSDEIPVSVLSENVEWDSTHTLVDVLGSIDVDVTGTIQDQISQLFNGKVSNSDMQAYVTNSMPTYITSWLNTNVNPVGSAVVVDSSLTVSGAAADAKVVGDKVAGLDDLKSATNALLPAAYSVKLSALGIDNCIPFYAVGGDVITVKTVDGSSFTVHEIRFVDKEKQNVAYWGLVNYGSERTFTIPTGRNDIYYCYLNLGTAQAVTVVNNSSSYNLKSVIDEKVSFKQVESMLGVNSENLFDGIEKVDGKYVNFTNGNLNNSSAYSATDYFIVFPGAKYKLTYKSSGSQIAFYDKNKAYVTGFTTTTDTFTVSDNDSILYARWCAETVGYANWGLYLEPLDSAIKYITTSDGILNGIIDAVSKNIKKVVVEAGTYDLIAEYKARYGDDYFTNYATNYNGLANGYYDRGIWLDNIELIFQSGSKVTAIYDGANSNVVTYFSAFAMGQNVKIDGLVLDARNLRYGIHPDFHPTNYGYLEMRNCDLHHFKEVNQGVNDNQAIGAGLDIHSAWLFENCIFRSDTNHAVFRIHNNASSEAESKIIIKDCYIAGNGFIRLNSYSTSEKQTMAMVTGCSWVTPPVVGKETEASTDNITMLAWNNEERT